MEYHQYIEQIAEAIALGSRDQLNDIERAARMAGLKDKELEALQELVDSALCLIEP